MTGFQDEQDLHDNPVNLVNPVEQLSLLFKQLSNFKHLFRRRPDPIVLRQINPLHGSARINQELGRSRDVFTIYTCAFVRQIVTSNHFRTVIGKDWKSVTLTLRELA